MPLQDCARLMRVAAYRESAQNRSVRIGDGLQECQSGGDQAHASEEGNERHVGRYFSFMHE